MGSVGTVPTWYEHAVFATDRLECGVVGKERNLRQDRLSFVLLTALGAPGSVPTAVQHSPCRCQALQYNDNDVINVRVIHVTQAEMKDHDG